MNDNYSTAERKISERLSHSRLSAIQEEAIDWKRAEREVNRMQARIARAAQNKKWNTVKRLQYLQAHSFYAKAVSARHNAWEKRRKRQKTQEIERELSDIIKKGKAWNQNVLIGRLNRQIRKWAQACPDGISRKAGARVDYMLYEWLWRWAKRRHPRKGKRWVLERYWHRREGRKWVFSTDTRALLLAVRVCNSHTG